MKKRMRDILLKNSKDIDKKSIFWNMLFSGLSSLQLAIMLLLVSRICGADDAGILSIAYATAYLMYAIGAYGVRNFQATDSQRYYSYRDYKMVRIITCFLMIIAGLIYCCWRGYKGYKAVVVSLVCLLKLEEAFEDLYHGELQRRGRLDIAGQLGTFRLCLCYIIFLISLVISQNLLIAISSIVVVSFIVLIITKNFLDGFVIKDKNTGKEGKKIKLLTACFPLFITTFFRIYINDAPKYAIDTCLSEKEQAYYAVIAMPVFVIGLFSGMIYRPKLFQMAEMWNSNNRNEFNNLVKKQLRNVLVIMLAVIAGGFTIGLKILEIIYEVSLMALRKEFALLLLGGGMLAIYYFLSDCLTVIRGQIFMPVVSGFVMLIAIIISNPIVRYAGVTGAVYLYFILMSTQAIMVSVVFHIYLKKGYKVE